MCSNCKGHDKGGCPHRRFPVVAQHGSKDDEHHHSAAGAEETGSKANGQPKKQGNCNLLHGQPVGSFVRRLVFGIRLHQEADTDGHT